jgi:hypothetical protein
MLFGLTVGVSAAKTEWDFSNAGTASTAARVLRIGWNRMNPGFTVL